MNVAAFWTEVARITGLKRTVVEKYADDFKLGKENGRLKDFVGAAGKGGVFKAGVVPQDDGGTGGAGSE